VPPPRTLLFSIAGGGEGGRDRCEQIAEPDGGEEGKKADAEAPGGMGAVRLLAADVNEAVALALPGLTPAPASSA
jgi:hypothetical protein